MAMERLRQNSPLCPDDIAKATDAGDQPSATAGRFLRTLTGPEVSVGLGVGIVLAVLANRIATPVLVDSQARTDILGVIAGGGLITNGVYLLVSTHRRFYRTSHRIDSGRATVMALRRGLYGPRHTTAIDSCGAKIIMFATSHKQPPDSWNP